MKIIAIAIAIRKEPVFCVFIEFVYRNREETIECIMIYESTKKLAFPQSMCYSYNLNNFILFEFIYGGK